MINLEAIRRPAPVCPADGLETDIQKIEIGRRPNQSEDTPSGAVFFRPEGIITLSSDSEDGPPGGSGTAQDPFSLTPVQQTAAPTGPAFYGLRNIPLNEQNDLLRYQLQDVNPGQLPSPAAGTRFNMRLLFADCNVAPPNDQAVQDAADFARYRGGRSVAAPLDDAIVRNWTQDRSVVPLLRGLPLAEDVTFFRPANLQGTPSNCYWKAVAYQQYGDHRYDTRVKAEHLAYVGEVLNDATHPRHQQYVRLNSRFWQTWVDFGGNSSPRRPTCANLWQLLNVPSIWTSMDMFDVTADLYNWFIVVYTVSDSRCTEVTASTSKQRGKQRPLTFDNPYPLRSLETH